VASQPVFGHAPTTDEDRPQPWLQFASVAAHEIVGPADQILSLVALFILRYRGKVDDEADALLALMEQAQARLGATSAGLRRCFQVSSGSSVKVRVDMNEVFAGVQETLKTQIAESQAEVRTETLPDAQGDRQLLGLLLQNIIDNALKFRSAEVRPKVVVSALQSSNGLIFQVKDNGVGIDSQFSEAVFEPFKKLNGHLHSGAGLGLTLARMIVELHGGRIWIEPVLGGTAVRFELPAG
jgi:light-regulated signal transduction histidine kinase (bacteriophytochrome)